MYSLYLLGIRITLEGGDELPLIVIEEKIVFFFIELIKRIVQVLPTYIHQGDIKRK